MSASFGARAAVRKVTLIDVAGLKKVSCECYETIRRDARELPA